jgi:glycosyltransferase involved in cell wall biosynthesis
MSAFATSGAARSDKDPGPGRGEQRPHLIYLAVGFPPAAKSCAYRMRETANQFAAQGWDVTVVTVEDESWKLESGIDHTLSEKVDPRIAIVKLPLRREDLETDIRRYSEKRALTPAKWVKSLRDRQQESFPEMNFGDWRGALEAAVLRIHQDKPADLLLATCVPYTNLAAAWKLWEEARVPYAVDFRDGWSIDVIDGREAFTRDSENGRWEERVLGSAVSLWVVNDPIAEHYRARYPELADRVHVVRNGYDVDSAPGRSHSPDPESGLVFGYLGTVNFSTEHLRAVLEGWRAARKREPLLANARFEVRGHIGHGSVRGASPQVELLRDAEADGVTYGGPVLILIGGRYVTSGKVYEYMATGLPIVSAHAIAHDASNVLKGHPLWTGPRGIDSKALANAFVQAAHLAVESTPEQHAEAMTHADRFTREIIMSAAVKKLVSELPVRKGDTQ